MEQAAPLSGPEWDKALARYRPLLVLLARQLLNPRHWKKVDPSDIVQKTMFKAHQKRAAFRGSSEGELQAWLRIILRHLVIDVGRQLDCDRNGGDREVPMTDVASSSPSPSGRIGRHEEALRIARAIEKLPEDQRLAIELHHLQGRSLVETAEHLKRSRSAVASLLHRAQVLLRGLLRR